MTTRCTAARSWVGLVGSARSNSRSGRAGGSASVRSIMSRSSSRRRWRSNWRSRSRGTASGSGRVTISCSLWPFSPSVRRMRWTSTPITPLPVPSRPKAAIASRARSRISPSEPSRTALRICAPQAVQVEHVLVALVALVVGEAAVGQPALDGLALDRAEEVAVEEDVEHAPVLLRLRERRRERRAEVLLGRPRHVLERGEGVEQLGRAHVHALASQLVGELEQPRREAARPTGVR